MLVYRKREAERSFFPRPQEMPRLLHALLVQRGVASAAEAEAFLRPDETLLHDPLLLSDMGRAVSRLRAALEAGKRICVYGDYDVDGVTAAAILCLHLRSLGANVRAYIPDRHREGYGLNEAAVRSLAEKTDLLVTVDCGVNAVEMAALARELGMDIVITDHHRPGETLPDCPLIDPLLNGYPCPYLSGAGVAFKLVEALSGRAAAMEYIDLAALSTVADVVPLLGENRFIVRAGLQRMNEAPRPGIAALKRDGRSGRKNAHRRASGLSARPAPQRRRAAGQRAAGAGTAPHKRPFARRNAGKRAGRREQRAPQCGNGHPFRGGGDARGFRLSRPSRHRAGARGLEHRRTGAGGAARLVEANHYPVILLSEEAGVFEGLLPLHPRRGHLRGADGGGRTPDAIRRPQAGGGADARARSAGAVQGGAGSVSAKQRAGGDLGAGAGIRSGGDAGRAGRLRRGGAGGLAAHGHGQPRAGLPRPRDAGKRAAHRPRRGAPERSGARRGRQAART